MKALDKFLIKLFTRFAHAFQRLTGRTNYFLAKIGLLIFMTSISVSIASYAIPILPQKHPLWCVFLYGLLGIMEIRRMAKLDKAEKDALESPERTKHFFSEDNIMWRIIWLFFTAHSLLTLSAVPKITFWMAMDGPMFPIGLFIFHCFIAVDPLPPCKSKIRELLGAISAYLSPAKTAESEAS